MHIEFTYARGPDHFVAHPGVPRETPSPVPSYVIAALLVSAGAAFAVAAVVYDAAQAASCGVLGALLGVLIAVAARQRTRDRFVMPAEAMAPRQWTVTGDGIEIGHDGSSATIAWAAFQYGLELPRAYLFVMKDREDKRTFDIPREPLGEADDAAVRDVLARHRIRLYPHHPKVS